MAIQIMEAVQKRLSLPPLVKITPDGEVGARDLPRAPFHQAALVAVAAMLYKVTRTNEGCVHLLMSGRKDNWLDYDEAFGKRMPEVIEKINSYGMSDPLATEQLMRKIADACLLIMHEELANNMSTDSVRDFMSGQRHNILVYQPVDMKLGKLLNDSVWDDQTNHMEGPVSGFMHRIENLFS